MDLVSLVVSTLLGAIVGLVTGLVPGLHVNTLAAMAVVTASPTLAFGLIAAGTVHTFVAMIPTTYLGAPGEDTALATLPAHRMLLDGRGPDAIRISVLASLAAMLLAVLAILPLKWLLGQPGNLLPLLDRWTPWLLLLVVLVLAALDGATVRALAVAGLAAGLGWIAWDWSVSGLFGPSSALLPLLSGLFGLPTLLASLSNREFVPLQHPAGTSFLGRADIFWGTSAAAVTAVMPGMTAAVATALARPVAKDNPRAVVAALSAVNTAHLVLALATWWTLGRSRSGLALAAAPALPEPVPGGEVRALVPVVFVMLGAGALGALGTLHLDKHIAPRVHQLRGDRLALAGILVVVAINAVVAGMAGLALLVVAVLAGLLPLALGVRRVHLTAALLVPIAVTKLMS